MLNFKSWRLSRLTELSALKRIITHPQWVVVCLASIAVTCARDESTPPAIEVLCWFSWCLLGIALLQTICTADEYFEIKSSGKIFQRIYLYYSGIYRSDKMDMVIISKDKDVRYILKKMITDYYFWPDKFFTFCTDDTYYYLSSSKEPEILGKKLTNTCFREKNIKVLNQGLIYTFKPDFFILGDSNIFIPPTAARKIYSDKGKEKKPDNYLITKDGKRYTVYGLYEDEPRMESLRIPLVIFKEGGQDVAIGWSKELGYIEIYRTQKSVKRTLSTTFVELIDTGKSRSIYGIIKRLNEETLKMETLYSGRFYAIDFDSGAIIGEDGFEYNPS